VNFYTIYARKRNKLLGKHKNDRAFHTPRAGLCGLLLSVFEEQKIHVIGDFLLFDRRKKTNLFL
jgi:hypothetical protein